MEREQLEHSSIAEGGRAARGVVQGVAGRAVHFGVGYLASIVLARRLGPAAYGVYGVVMSVLLWVQQIGKFTLAPAAAKLISEQRQRSAELEQTAFFLNGVFFAAVFAFFWFGAPLLGSLFELPDGGAGLFRIAALDLPLFGVYVLYRGVLLGHRDFLATSIADGIYSLTKLAAVIVLLALWLSISSALLANVLASAGALVFVMSRRSIKVSRPVRDLVAPLCHLALPLGFYMLVLQTTGSLDLWFLQVSSSGQDRATIGMYVAARNVAMVPSVIFMVVSDVLLPSLARALATNDVGLARRYLQSGVRFLFIVMVPIALLFMLAADEIMVLFYSARFEGGGIYLRILIWYSVLLAFIDLFAASLSARGEPSLSGSALSVSIPIAAVLNSVLVPSYGAVGAAWASALSGSGGAVVLGTLVYRRFGSLMAWRRAVKAALAICLMGGIASQITARGPLLAAAYVGCLGIYVLGLVLLGEVTREDLEPFAFWRSRLI